MTKALLVAKGSEDGRSAFGPLAAAPVANRPLMEHALGTLATAGVEQIAVVAEPGAGDRVRQILSRSPRRDGVEIEIFDQSPKRSLNATLATARAILADDPFVLHLGDSLCWDLDLEWQDRPFGAADAVVLVQPDAAGHNGHNGARQVDRRRGPASGGASQPRFGHLGVYVVGPEFSSAVATGGAARDLSRDARRALALMASNGGQTHYWRKTESWRYSREPRSLLEANRLALGRLEPGRIPAHGPETDIHGPVEVHPSAVIEASVIRGPAVIGPRARICEAYIGPYTAIGSDVVIEGAEVGYSVIMDGASVRHISDRLEASVIGPDAQVFRDFRLPRAVRLEVGPAAEVVLV